MCASIGVTGYRRSGKLPAPLCHRSPALSQTVRGHGDAAPTRRIALSRSARLGSSPILKSNYRRRSSTPCVRIRGCLRACVCGYTIGVGCPSFTLCQELNTNGRFERSMVEHCSHRPSPRAERSVCFWMVCRPSEQCSYARSRERRIGAIRCRNGSQGA